MARELIRSFARILKRPGASLPGILILALTCGAVTVFLGTLTELWLSPLNLPDSERLFFAWETHAEAADTGRTVSLGLFSDFRSGAPDLAEIALTQPARPILWHGDKPVALRGSQVSAGFLRTLGLTPAHGRDFRIEDEDPAAQRAILISHATWQRHFGAERDLDALSARIDFGSGIQEARVVGVLPAGQVLGPPLLWEEAQVLTALPHPKSLGRGHFDSRSYRLVARLHPGTSRAQLADRLGVLYEAARERYPENFGSWKDLQVEPAEEVASAPFHRPLLVLGVLGALFLFIACANVVVLTWERHQHRAFDLGIRSALGAGPAEIRRYLVAEAVAGALASALPGFFVATALAALFARFVDDPQLRLAGVDPVAFLAAVGLVLGLNALLSLVPTLRWERAARSRPGHEREERRQGLLLAVEIAAGFLATAVALSVTAGLVTLLRADLGFEPRGRITADLRQSSTQGQDPRLYEQAARAVEQLDGVVSAGVVRALPMDGGLFLVDAWAPGTERRIEVRVDGIGPGALESLGATILEGRGVQSTDLDASAEGWERPAWISRSLARALGPETREVSLGFGSGRPLRIVGVVEDMRRDGPAEPAHPVVYIPFTVLPRLYAYLVVHADESPTPGLQNVVRRTVENLDPRLVVERVRPLPDIVSEHLKRQTLMTLIGLALTLLSLALTASGVWAVAGRRIAGRRRELGVRLAFGARPEELRRRLLRGAAKDLGLGLALGVVGALVTRRLASTLIGEVPFPLLSILVAAGLLALLVLGIFALSARRLGKLDPSVLLSED